MTLKNRVRARTRTKKSRMLRAIGTMPTQLLDRCNAIRALLAEGTRLDAQHRYRVAQLIKEVWDANPKYGQSAMAQLAASLDWSTSTAYRYKNVAETFTPDEFDRMLEKCDEYGRPLTWLHLVELSKVETNEERQELLATVLNDGLSARQLGKKISTNTTEKRKAQPKQTSGPTTDGVQKLAMESKAFADEVQLRTVRLAEKFDRVNSATARQNLEKEIVEVRNGLMEASRACQTGVERLDECLQIHKVQDASAILQFSASTSRSQAAPATAGA